MTRQFTASEVREKAGAFCDECLMPPHTTGQMLAAYADRLEADEKVAPVGTTSGTVNTVRQFAEPVYRLQTVIMADGVEQLPPGTKLYTHPSPFDAERLAEALEQAMQSLRTIERGAMREEGLGDAGNVRAYARSRANVAINALGAHSTQAQPSAASVECVWAEAEDGNWDTGCGYMFVLTEGTPYDNEMGFCCYCGGTIDQVTQEIVVQENPNG